MDKKEMLQAIQNRDKSYNGRFIFGVKTTKIICVAGCPSKIPIEKNIIFFSSLTEAIQNGYRPCKRCKPEKYYKTKAGGNENGKRNSII